MKTVKITETHDERLSRAKMQHFPAGAVVELSDARAQAKIDAGKAEVATPEEKAEAKADAKTPKATGADVVKVDNVKG